jgi:hypothetical protein
MSTITTLEEKIQKIPPEKIAEVEDFVESILEQVQQRTPTYLRMTWAGGLKEFREQYSSVELQHEILNECVK